MLTRSRLCIAAVALASVAGHALAQTNPAPRAVPFTEDFGTVGSTTAPTGFAGWNGMSGASITTQAGAEGSTPTGNASILSSTPTNGGTGGLYFYAPGSNGRIAVNTSSNATNGVNQWVLAINTTGQSGMTLQYDLINVVANTRPVGTVAQYRLGHAGAWTSIPGTNNPYVQSGGSTETVTHVSLSLPSALDNQAEAQIRFAVWRATGSGNSSAFAIDNMSITSSGSNPNLGACCAVAGTCTPTLLADCTAGTFQGAGTVCSPNPCPQPSGSCCIAGVGCMVVNSPAECTTAGGTSFVANGLCNPGPCIPPAPVAVQPCDIALATSNAAATSTLFQIRGAGAPSSSVVGSWGQNPFIEFARFDNAGGTNHNAHGNLLGLNFGNAGGAGPLYTYATDGSNNATLILDQIGFNTIIGLASNPRVGGLSVSPSNDRIAVVGYDASVVAVLSYNAGATPGTGSGAAITGGAATTSITYLTSPKGTWGTAWLDENSTTHDATLLVAVRTGGQALKLYTLPVSGFDSGTTFGAPVERLSVLDPGPDSSPQTSIIYNPQIAPYIFLLSSAFASPVSTNTLYIIDPATWTVAKQVDLSTSMQTGRDLALGCDKNLYFATRVDASRPLVTKLVVDTDSNGTITAADIAAIGNNSTTDFYSNSMVGTASFTGIDIGLAASAPAQGACCTAATGVCTPALTAAACSTQGGVYQGDSSTCSPNPCPQPQTGVCCRGATCNTTFVSAAACTGSITGSPAAGSNFFTGSTCNSGTVSSTPCCYADYNKTGGISVQDIFDFLADWFAGFPYANTGGSGVASPLTVQNIFDFLSNWFAGGC